MTGRVGDLTTLAHLKAWRSPAIVGTADDAAIQREITACSKFILNYLQRDLIAQPYTDRRNGNGQSSMTLRNRPLISVTSVKVYGTSIPAVNEAANQFLGFTWDNNEDLVFNTGMLYLNGYCFAQGQQNVSVDYVAGFLVSNEEAVIPITPGPYEIQCSSLFELWLAPYSVAYANGTLLTPVKSAPTIGQYVPASAPDGKYTFAAADQGADILITYSYTPKDIEAACVTTVILEYNRRSRIGEDSKVLAGETITYSKRALSDTAIDMLQSYIDVVPVMP